jgi:hypothetical protein
MKDTQIPGYFPKIDNAPNGYKWVYRGLGWQGYSVKYAAISQGRNYWFYSSNIPSNTNALDNYHYVELVKINSLDNIESASLEEQLQIANDIVKSGKRITYQLLGDGGFDSYVFNKIEVAVDYASAQSFSRLVASAYNKTNKPVVVLTTRNGPPCISLFDIYQKPTSVSVKLNNQYDAIVTSDTIQVGCQKFPISILKSLQDAHKSL